MEEVHHLCPTMSGWIALILGEPQYSRCHHICKDRALTIEQSCWHLDLGLHNMQDTEKQNFILHKLSRFRYSVIAVQMD